MVCQQSGHWTNIRLNAGITGGKQNWKEEGMHNISTVIISWMVSNINQSKLLDADSGKNSHRIL